VPLPTGFIANSNAVLAGRENGVTGTMLQGFVASTTGLISVTNYDNTYPGASGHQIIVSGMIEVQ
jgi:hypothetical protein